MNFPLIANIVVFVALLFVLAQARHKQWSLAKKCWWVWSWAWCLVLPCIPFMVQTASVKRLSTVVQHCGQRLRSVTTNDRYATGICINSQCCCSSA